MNRKTNLFALLAAAAMTVLAVAGLSTAASSAAPVNTAEPKISGTGHRHDHLQVPVAPLQRAGQRLFEHRWSRFLELSAEDS